MSATVMLALALADASNLASAADLQLEEVVVTARRHPERLLDVPIAMTSVSRQNLQHAGIGNLADLAAAVPGMSVALSDNGMPTPILRGLNGVDAGTGWQNVATVVDGVYVANGMAVDLFLPDSERIDVLRGPQNALIGRDAFAGAIIYSSAEPTQGFAADAQAAMGEGDYFQASGYLNGSLTPSLRMRVAALSEAFDGRVHNDADRTQPLGGWRKASGSLALTWQPNAALQATLKAHRLYEQLDAGAHYDVRSQFNCGLWPGSTDYANYCGSLPETQSVDISPDARGREHVTSLSSFTVQWQAAPWTLRSVTGYVGTTFEPQPEDFDFSSSGAVYPVVNIADPYALLRLQNANQYFSGELLSDHEWSQDLQLEHVGEHVDWSIGAYYANNSARYEYAAALDSSTLAADEMFASVAQLFATSTPLSLLAGGLNSRSVEIYAGYGSLTWRPRELLELSAEARWSHQRYRDVEMLSFTLPSSVEPLQARWVTLTPKLVARYHLQPDTMLYASIAKGVRAGGTNISTIAAERTFDPEHNWTYEVGAKLSAADDRIYIDGALFWIDWRDLQINGISADANNTTTITRNTGGAFGRGVEVSVQAKPARWLDVGLGYSFNDVRFRSDTTDVGILNRCTPDICRFVSAGPSAGLPDISGNYVPGAARQSATLNMTLKHTFSTGWQTYLRADLAVTDRQFIATDNAAWIPGRKLLNLRIGVDFQRWRWALWGRNLANERIAGAMFNNNYYTPYNLVVQRSNGSRWGMSVGYGFE